MSSRTVLDLEIWLLQASRYDVQQGLSRDIRCRLWNKRAKPGTHLTVVLLNSEHRIVFLVDTTATPQVVKRGYKRYLRHLTAGSPFRSSHTDVGCVLAFEVEWRNIGGIDYSNPLCLPGRLVLESKAVFRREFNTREEADAFYTSSIHQSLSQADISFSGAIETNGIPPDWKASPSFSGTTWQSPTPSPGPKFRLGQSMEKRTPHRRRISDSASGLGRRHDSPAPLSATPRRWTTNDAAATERQTKKTTQKDYAEKLGSDNSKRKWGESMEDDLQDSASSELQKQSRDLRPEQSLSSSQIGAGEGDGAKIVQPQSYRYRTITFNFDEPFVPVALKPWIEGDERLLKLYESGLPAWAIYAPQYGIWYRPWMRSVTYFLFILVSSFSLVMGFYDLYKNVPYLDQFLRQYGRFPAAAIMHWLDSHLSFRLSILFAYLFGKSELAVSLLRYMGTFGAMCREALQPLNIILRPAFSSWLGSVREIGASFVALGRVVGNSVSIGISTVIFQPLVSLGLLLYTGILPIFQAISYVGLSLTSGPLTAMQAIVAGLMGSLIYARDLCIWMANLFKAFGQAFKAGSTIAPEVSASASQVTWLYSTFRVEALEVLRTSFMKVVRALQTLTKLCAHWGTRIARHRLTLELRFRRQRQKARTRLKQCTPAWLHSIFRWMLADRDKHTADKGPTHSQTTEESEMVLDAGGKSESQTEVEKALLDGQKGENKVTASKLLSPSKGLSTVHQRSVHLGGSVGLGEQIAERHCSSIKQTDSL